MMKIGDFTIDMDFEYRTSEKNEDNVHVFYPVTHNDDRGFFRVNWSDGKGGVYDGYNRFVDMEWTRQWNTSKSKKNVFRGMHAQKGANCQGKLVTCKHGRIVDLIVDARNGSKTYLKAKSYVLDSEVGTMLWVPRGFLHGFLSLAEDAVFDYLCDAQYDHENEVGSNIFSMIGGNGVDFSDASDFLDDFVWLHNSGNLVISKKDLNLPDLSDFEKNNQGIWWKG